MVDFVQSETYMSIISYVHVTFPTYLIFLILIPRTKNNAFRLHNLPSTEDTIILNAILEEAPSINSSRAARYSRQTVMLPAGTPEVSKGPSNPFPGKDEIDGEAILLTYGLFIYGDMQALLIHFLKMC